MAVDKALNRYEVEARVEATPTLSIQAPDPQSAAELAEASITLTLNVGEADGVVEIEDVSEVESRA